MATSSTWTTCSPWAARRSRWTIPLQGFPEVGEIPYGCVWVARGTLEQDLDDSTGEPLVNSNGDPVYDITWRASERLTSGRRDPHQIDITSSPGAGFIISWQEDPEGLRPGKGLGPGEGWSGAIANSKTDIWYTYIDLDHFDDVCLDDVEDVYCTPGTLADFTDQRALRHEAQSRRALCHAGAPDRQQRLQGVQKFDTNGELIDPYCYADFDDNGTADLCATTEILDQPRRHDAGCLRDRGRPRPDRPHRLHPRALGDEVLHRMPMATGQRLGALGRGKDEGPGHRWLTTAIRPPTQSAPSLTSARTCGTTPSSSTSPSWWTQGLMLNAPAISPETGEPFEIYVDEWGNEIYDTEIARRFNLFVNSPAAAMASESKTMGILIYKEGILFQGGPADIFIRRIVLPEDFDPAVDNPFAYENVRVRGVTTMMALPHRLTCSTPTASTPTTCAGCARWTA